MRIALVSEHASPLAAIGGVDAGGQNVHVASLALALADRGHEVTVYTRRDDRRLPARQPLGHGAWVEHIDAGPPEPIPKDEIFPHVRALAEGLAQAWEAHRPDVVHSHFWMSGLASLQAAAPMKVPVLHTFHALGTVKRRHQGSRDTSPPERIDSEVNITQQADRVIATCTDEVFELVRMGADVARVSIVPCGVDTRLFAPGGSGAAHRRIGDRRLVALGRLVERKGIDDVIRALPDVPGAELIVAGGPEASLLPHDPDAVRLRALADRHGVSGRVRLIGRLSREEVPALLRSSDLAVCVPWYEPFGIVPLEAMACALPVVASAVGGLTDTVVDGATGVHVPSRRPAALASTLRHLLADDGLRRSMGRAGRARVVERYTWSKVAEATASAYERTAELASANGQRRGQGDGKRVALG